MAFDLTPHRHDPVRLEFLEIGRAALAAVDPDAAVRRHLQRRDDTLVVGGRALRLADYDRVVVLGLGKAAVPMGRATVDVLADRSLSGVLVTNDPGPAGDLEVVAGSHPVPDDRSIRGGTRLLEVAADLGPRDLAVVLVSGGGSALATVPAPGLTLDDLRATSELLLRSGAPIDELNTVRKQLSAIKGGRLASAMRGVGAVATLILSDVVGNPLDVIASGPTVPNLRRAGDALAIITNRGLAATVPKAVHRHLFRESLSPPETPGLGPDVQTIVVIGDAATAAGAAAAAAEERGWRTRVVDTALTGEARDVGRHIATGALGLAPGEMLVHAGETTVTVTGDGRGGRNQELALAACLELAGHEGALVMSLGTDGIDGMSPAAGGFADGTAVDRAYERGVDPRAALDRNDSYPLLEAIGNVIVSGPTGTNVGDLMLAGRRPR